MLWPTLESLSLVSVNERETIWASFSGYHALGLWTIHLQSHLRTISFIYTKYWVSRKDTVWGEKRVCCWKCKLQFYDTLTRPRVSARLICKSSKSPWHRMSHNFISRKSQMYFRSMWLMNEHARKKLWFDQFDFILEMLSGRAKLSKRTKNELIQCGQCTGKQKS